MGVRHRRTPARLVQAGTPCACLPLVVCAVFLFVSQLLGEIQHWQNALPQSERKFFIHLFATGTPRGKNAAASGVDLKAISVQPSSSSAPATPGAVSLAVAANAAGAAIVAGALLCAFVFV